VRRGSRSDGGASGDADCSRHQRAIADTRADPNADTRADPNADPNAGRRLADSDHRRFRRALSAVRRPARLGRTVSDRIEPSEAAGRALPELPYGPRVARMLAPLDRALRVMNRWYVLPAIKAGLGPLHANPVTGSWMLLRTTGRRSGRVREVALGYAILDSAVYCSAGFGPRTAWYRNLVAEPRVEVVLPGVAFAGTAETVIEEAELDRAWRALIRSLGLLGRGFVGSPAASPEELAHRTASLPLVRIRPVGIAPGPADPGGRLWLTLTAVGVAWLVVRLGRGWRRRG